MITSADHALTAPENRPPLGDGSRFAAALLVVVLVAIVEPQSLDELLRWLVVVWTSARPRR